jgi:type I site-specific restriction-modification system R (restriction) subunit
MTDDSIPTKSVSKREMQELCQKHQLLEKINNKELKPVLLKERHANPLKSGQVFCTYSQLVSFQDSSRNEVMKAHQYKKPNGSLGASKMPDPVWLFIDGVIYKLEGKTS